MAQPIRFDYWHFKCFAKGHPDLLTHHDIALAGFNTKVSALALNGLVCLLKYFKEWSLSLLLYRALQVIEKILNMTFILEFLRKKLHTNTNFGKNLTIH